MNENIVAASHTTLTTSPVSTLLAALFAESKQTDGAIRSDLAKLSPDERAAFMAGAKTDYREFYGRARELFLPVSPETGRLLYMLARARRATSIVEYGTSFGISTIHLAAAVKDNGGGKIIGCEFEPSKVVRARKNLDAAGLSSLVDIREGDALETLARDLPASIDMVLLDGAKVLYPRVLALLEPHLAKGAIVVADNADDSPDYVAHVRAPEHGYLSLPFGEDVELSVRIAESSTLRPAA
jgi:predicted O-methyltransferase YrrM